MIIIDIATVVPGTLVGPDSTVDYQYLPLLPGSTTSSSSLLLLLLLAK